MAHHNLQVELFPKKQRLQVLDRIAFDKHPGDRIMFQLSPRAEKVKVSVGDQEANFDFNNGELQINLGAVLQNRKVQVAIGYTATFDDPAPIRPLNADNPGYGVSGTIQPEGTFLLAGAGWYPHIAATDASYALRVTAPAGCWPSRPDGPAGIQPATSRPFPPGRSITRYGVWRFRPPATRSSSGVLAMLWPPPIF